MFNNWFNRKNYNLESKEAIDIRENHYEKYFGPMSNSIMHSTDKKFPHIDIYQFLPNSERNYWTLITGGMSDFRQNFPKNKPEYIANRAEIIMYVSEPQGWMFGVLKGLAEMPFKDNTFLHW